MSMSVADVKPIPFPLHGVLGEPGRSVRIAILAEGFVTAKDHQLFRDTAAEVTAFLIGRSPFREYLDRFVVVGIDCSSIKSARLLKRNTRRPYDNETPFDVTFDFPGRNTQSVVLRGLHWEQSAVDAVPRAAFPNVTFDAMLVIVNSEEDGGRADPGAKTASLTLDGAAPTFVHELGHSLAGLADEYEQRESEGPRRFTGSDPVEPNVTTEQDPQRIKWGDLLSGIDIPSTKPDTPGDCSRNHSAKDGDFEAPGTVGLFEGAHQHSCGIYRPSFECRMRSGGPFCRVCADAIRRILVGGRLLAARSFPPQKTDRAWTHVVDIDGLYGRTVDVDGHLVSYSVETGEMALVEKWRMKFAVRPNPPGPPTTIPAHGLQTVDSGWMTLTPFASGGAAYILGTRFDTALRAIIRVMPENAWRQLDVFATLWVGSDDDGPWTHVVAFELSGATHLLSYNFFNGRLALDRIVENMGLPEPQRLASTVWLPGWNNVVALDRAGAPHVAFINAILGTAVVAAPHAPDAAGNVLTPSWPSAAGFLPRMPTHATGITIGAQPLLITYTPTGSVAIHSLRLGGARASLDFNQRRGLGFGAQMLLGTGAPAMGAFGTHLWFYGAATQELRYLEFA